MTECMGMRPTAAEITEWKLRVIRLPVVRETTGWADYDDLGACDHCGDTPVYPARPDGALHDGDPAVCVTCGLVRSICADEGGGFLSDAYAVLREDDHARLFDVLAGEVGDE